MTGGMAMTQTNAATFIPRDISEKISGDLKYLWLASITMVCLILFIIQL